MVELHLAFSASQDIAFSKDNVPLFTFGKPARTYDIIANRMRYVRAHIVSRI